MEPPVSSERCMLRTASITKKCPLLAEGALLATTDGLLSSRAEQSSSPDDQAPVKLEAQTGVLPAPVGKVVDVASHVPLAMP